MRVGSFALTAIFFATATSATAFAQSPDEPAPPPPPMQPQQTPPQPAPTTTSTTIVVPPAQPTPPPPAPVVVQPVPMANVTPAPIVPVSEETEDEWNAPMFTTGALVFAGSYGASVIVASSSDRKGDDRLWVPVVGPWLDLADRGTCPIEMTSCDHETTDKVLLVADGVFQAAGLLAMVDGIVQPIHRRRTVMEAREDYKKTHITPASLGAATPGFVVSGHF
jgi:hypothetical protein